MVVALFGEALGNFGNKKKYPFASTGRPFLSTQSSREDHTPFSMESLLTHSWMHFCAQARSMTLPSFHASFFSACLSAVNRFRTTFFPSSSGSTSSALDTRETIRTDAMQVWESFWRVLVCDALTTESGVQMPDVWAALLAVIESERLYTTTSTFRTGNQNMAAYCDPGCASIAVKGLALATVESTGRVWDSNDMPTATPSVDTDDMLTRIEYELVGDELHRTLGAVVTNWDRPFWKCVESIRYRKSFKSTHW